LDFNDLEAIRLINEILLLEYFEIDVKISPNVLVPRIPQKLNYILLIEDLINQNKLQNDQIFGLDIG
jgi:U6 snRNA m6A methyltransferase